MQNYRGIRKKVIFCPQRTFSNSASTYYKYSVMIFSASPGISLLSKQNMLEKSKFKLSILLAVHACNALFFQINKLKRRI
jgi:hypothetical protein